MMVNNSTNINKITSHLNECTNCKSFCFHLWNVLQNCGFLILKYYSYKCRCVVTSSV
jgi:hypothetical protein